ncbi:cell division protein ZapA [Schleiferilactobacillus perolens]|uniref:cell division protein ZapA n=1 Tax=Schleiferilactobacillus perolens TaxID=100468 RepID=UPI0007091B97|nr:cell division protein ZapA [Schleiferilactobacillus perolens]MCI1891238.1 cell division protein ZapA [Schleiferilactobacillus harbinensis]MCI1911824.1 cell division protein ZapA [Schleiferilactobacillus harbinensis]MCI2171595.1 cell division protein ZapA [Schleiferilactobacillus perolens]
MAEDKRRYKATIGNKTYTIVGPGSDEFMATVTAILNEQLTTIHSLAPQLSEAEAAILLAFNTVSDDIKLKEQVKQLQDQKDDHDAAQSPKDSETTDD